MEKEVKFKVWDKKLNVMWQPILLQELLRYLVFQSMPNSDAYCAMKDHFKEMVWLEFTGLKDKNGKEIYEGDICRIDWKDSRYEPVVGKVDWHESEAAWCFSHGTVSEVSWSHEVIGNIYENPELLK